MLDIFIWPLANISYINMQKIFVLFLFLLMSCSLNTAEVSIQESDSTYEEEKQESNVESNKAFGHGCLPPICITLSYGKTTCSEVVCSTEPMDMSPEKEELDPGLEKELNKDITKNSF